MAGELIYNAIFPALTAGSTSDEVEIEIYDDEVSLSEMTWNTEKDFDLRISIENAAIASKEFVNIKALKNHLGNCFKLPSVITLKNKQKIRLKVLPKEDIENLEICFMRQKEE